tara:strand:- start:134 stop:451 length:318 start_codon:yes stop_codon:yes gene_type:complete
VHKINQVINKIKKKCDLQFNLFKSLKLTLKNNQKNNPRSLKGLFNLLQSRKTFKKLKIVILSSMETNKMIFPPAQLVFGLLLLSIAVVLIWDIRYSPFGEDEDGI